MESPIALHRKPQRVTLNGRWYQVRAAIEAAGAGLLYMPPYSPDFNPIEKAFSKLEALLRKAAERSVAGLWDAIGRLIDCFTPKECQNFFMAAGYEPV